MAELSDKQVKAAHLLVTGMASKDVASEVNVTPETVSHWKHEPAFQAYFNNLRWEVMENSRERIRSLLTKAIDTVEDLMENSKTDSVRLKAAQSILNVYGPTTDQAWNVGDLDEAAILVKEEKAKIWDKINQAYLA